MKSLLPFMAVFLTVTPAFAHIVASPDSGPADSYFQTSLRVSHGCENSPTIEVHVKIPESIITVRPQFKPGWTVQTIKRKLDHPTSAGHGKMVEEAISEIIWQGNALPADEYDDFGLLMKLPNASGQTLWFPVNQVCEDGHNNWHEIPVKGQQWHDLHAPAPFVRILPAKQ